MAIELNSSINGSASEANRSVMKVDKVEPYNAYLLDPLFFCVLNNLLNLNHGGLFLREKIKSKMLRSFSGPQ